MAVADDIERILRHSFNVKVTNVPELEHAVVIVLDYSPTDSERPLSMAFGFNREPKCWLTLDASMVRKIGEESPSSHSPYRQFMYHGRLFHPYSIQALDRDVFDCVSKFESICHRMYSHAIWS